MKLGLEDCSGKLLKECEMWLTFFDIRNGAAGHLEENKCPQASPALIVHVHLMWHKKKKIILKCLSRNHEG